MCLPLFARQQVEASKYMFSYRIQERAETAAAHAAAVIHVSRVLALRLEKTVNTSTQAAGRRSCQEVTTRESHRHAAAPLPGAGRAFAARALTAAQRAASGRRPWERNGAYSAGRDGAASPPGAAQTSACGAGGFRQQRLLVNVSQALRPCLRCDQPAGSTNSARQASQHRRCQPPPSVGSSAPVFAFFRCNWLEGDRLTNATTRRRGRLSRWNETRAAAAAAAAAAAPAALVTPFQSRRRQRGT
ncbi:uncharacterized protein LOC126336102 [Schistocerca gregaria]|uniref:uncharacterized protein LOC126336102 n=1 Tax=Schistocerca gregaria TaxID=7010 RepID=UPI00211DFFF9|nr:uncharacterized protein LOC126336102 [Schistocerca gregaria]